MKQIREFIDYEKDFSHNTELFHIKNLWETNARKQAQQLTNKQRVMMILEVGNMKQYLVK